MIKHQGGCHCGEFSIKVELDPLIVTLCHCIKCRRLTGAVVSNCFYEMSEVQFEGETLLYDYIGGSGKTVHHMFALTATPLYIELQMLSLNLNLLRYLVGGVSIITPLSCLQQLRYSGIIS